jgi:hypothetical protein
MHGLTSGRGAVHGFVRSASLLAACIFIFALLLTPVAVRQTGSGNPLGLAIAATICLVSGLLSELTASLLARSGPLAGTLAGMGVRMILPLGVCVALLAAGQNGRQHLAFIGYLLAFYIVTLALETCLAVKRASSHLTNLKHDPR